MKEAVIVSTARTPIGKAYRGAFNDTKSPSMAGHAIRESVKRAGIDPGEIDDVIVGSAMTCGTAGLNIGRMAALAAGLPDSVAGQTVGRPDVIAGSPPKKVRVLDDCSDKPVGVGAKVSGGRAKQVGVGAR